MNEEEVGPVVTCLLKHVNPNSRLAPIMKKILTVVIVLVVAMGIFEWYKKRFVAAAYVSEGLALAVTIKNQVAMFYDEYGRFPSSNQELDLPGPEQFAAQSIASLAISNGGAITVTFNELSGTDGGTIQMVPDTTNPAVGVRWRCETPSYKNISDWAPQCKFVP